jgi:hypothetical protein
MDSKHRSSYALNKIDELFYERITSDEEASKMADIWTIENLWVYIRVARSSEKSGKFLKFEHFSDF